MLLEDERGISIPFGVLYYSGSKRRVEVPLNDELRTKTLQAIRSIRELSLLDAPPEPLPAEMRHRCFGCWLATICQPEETLLLKDCFSALCTVGFDPYHGFFHVGRHGKPSLALDLMEEFRAIIADSVVLTLINNEVLTAKDFLLWRESCQLTEDGRKRFFGTYE